MLPRRCVRCQAEFTPSVNHQKYCQISCLRASETDARHSARGLIVKPCKTCNKDFQTVNPIYKYCSDTCRLQSVRDMQKAANRRWRDSHKEYQKEYTKVATARNKEWRKSNPTEAKVRDRKYKWGYTKELWEQALASQDYRCTICGEPHTESKPLHVDHKHGVKPILIRGLLCVDCNKMLGFAEDDVEILIKAIKYLERFK